MGNSERGAVGGAGSSARVRGARPGTRSAALHLGHVVLLSANSSPTWKVLPHPGQLKAIIATTSSSPNNKLTCPGRSGSCGSGKAYMPRRSGAAPGSAVASPPPPPPPAPAAVRCSAWFGRCQRLVPGRLLARRRAVRCSAWFGRCQGLLTLNLLRVLDPYLIPHPTRTPVLVLPNLPGHEKDGVFLKVLT